MAQSTIKRDPKVMLLEKKKRKQRQKKLMKSTLAIIMAILLVGLALAPVFSQTYEASPHRSGNNLIVSDQEIRLTAAEASAAVGRAVSVPDADYQGFIDFMMDEVSESYYKDTDKQSLIEGAYKGIFEALDPYSTYFTPDEYDKFNTSIEGEFSGIGASITEGKNGYVEVVAPIKGTPAEKAGLMPGDMIITIDGVDAAGFTTEKAVTLIRGEKGTHVILGIRRAGSEEILIFDIIRDTIIVKSVNYKLLAGNIGYIELVEFSAKTNSEFDAAMAYMVNKNVKKLIVDVRNNPGGLLNTAIHVSDYFIPMGKEIVKIDYKGTNDRIYRATTEKAPLDVVVLTNGGSASASEIFAGSIQQTGSGKVIGELTYGKGTVQTISPLTNGGAIKMTIAEYKLAGDYKVNGVGVKPDIEVASQTRITDEILKSLAPMTVTAGNTSLNVYAAQQRLALLGYKVTANGILDAQTKAIIKTFQINQRLTQSSTLNNATLLELDKVIKSTSLSTYDPQLARALEYFK